MGLGDLRGKDVGLATFTEKTFLTRIKLGSISLQSSRRNLQGLKSLNSLLIVLSKLPHMLPRIWPIKYNSPPC